MNRKRSTVAFSLALFSIALALSVDTLRAQSPWDGIPHTGIIPRQLAQFESGWSAPSWQMQVERVPQLLRMHCPTLGSND